MIPSLTNSPIIKPPSYPNGLLTRTYGRWLNAVADRHLKGWVLEAVFEASVATYLQQMIQNDFGEHVAHRILSPKNENLQSRVDAALKKAALIKQANSQGFAERTHAMAQFLYDNMKIDGNEMESTGVLTATSNTPQIFSNTIASGTLFSPFNGSNFPPTLASTGGVRNTPFDWKTLLISLAL